MMSPASSAQPAASATQGLMWRAKRSLVSEQTRWAYLFLSPVLLHQAVFVVFPVFYAFYLSFHEWNMLSPTMKFVGLRNYEDLSTDPAFLQSLANTALFTTGMVVAVVVLSLLLALAFDRHLKGDSIFRATYYAPAVTSVIVIGVIWTWMFQPSFGIINLLLGMVGLPQPYWLSSPETALLSVTITAVWGQVGYFAVIFLAGLQGIDITYYEAAKVDGAGTLQRFRHVTLPLLMPTLFYVLVMVMIASFQVFGLIYAMTSGGPVGSTSVVVYFLYKQAFTHFKMGYASAAAYVLFAVIFVLTLIQFRYMGRRIEQ